MNQDRNNSGKRNFGGRNSGGRGNLGGRGNFGGRGNSGFRRDNFSSENREMHKAVCSKCKKACEVPFKPIEGKPVFCKECYAKEKRF